jgi:AcrR family transcriptional regulator
VQEPPEGTRRQILEAALETLREVGFAGATSRAVAARGGFNQALVFYYFGSMDALLLAALDWTSEARLAAYRAALADASTIAEVVAAATPLYEEDRASGHIDVVSQMIAGSVSRPELAPQMIERMQPWIRLSEEVIDRVLARSPLADVIPTRDLAYAVVTFYLGANLLTHLDPAGGRAEALVARLADLAPALALPGPPDRQSGPDG